MIAACTSASESRAACHPQQVETQIAAAAARFTTAPLRAVQTARLNATPEVVFTEITGEAQMPTWITGLTRVTHDHSASANSGALGAGSLRSLHLRNGRDLERIAVVEAPHLFAYQILEGPPLKDHLAIMAVSPHPDGGSVFSWRQYFNVRPLTLGGLGMKARVDSFMRGSQERLIAKLGGEALHRCAPQG